MLCRDVRFCAKILLIATTFIAATFIAATFIAATFIAATFIASTFIAATFIAATFIAATFIAATFIAATFIAATFIAAFVCILIRHFILLLVISDFFLFRFQVIFGYIFLGDFIAFVSNLFLLMLRHIKISLLQVAFL